LLVLGIETSCDECSMALVRDGKKIESLVIFSQAHIHADYFGVVPEIASRLHIDTIQQVCNDTFKKASISLDEIDGIGVTNQPGLSGSLIVGLTYAKGLSLAIEKPFVTVDHILAHLYAVQLEYDVPYPYIGLLVSGGHSMICVVHDFDRVEVLGASIDDAVGEAFDKVAKHLNLGYPGGKYIDDLARKGNPKAYHFPKANLYKSNRKYDISFSGLKNAVINQRDQFWNGKDEQSLENICASFEKTAIDTMVNKIILASEHLSIPRVVAGGGVAANTYLRSRLTELTNLETYYPSFDLCTDNGAMIAGLAFHYLSRGDRSGLDAKVQPRVVGFKRLQ
jgi:N6-L-threonylcarbamoyladenine synthase